MNFKDLKYAVKIQVLFVPVFVLMAAGLLVVYQIAFSSLRQQHGERLERTAELTNNGLSATRQEMKRLVSLFQANRTLKEYLYITTELGGDRNALRNLLEPLVKTLAIDDIDLFDRRGRGVFDIDLHERDDEPHAVQSLAGGLPAEALSGFVEMNGLIEIAAITSE
nr:hypothetical protein [Nitrospiraceae bacterium]